ncbi:unnamed protein product [Diabrotica balteata]|uniref:Uncharacterized protein n=1 Tax=Diabrotica balteata TaxID=107213 RepID=A0A9N9XIF0_DIABA|nr:unnamed protein product [Diabrotica balteata]
MISSHRKISDFSLKRCQHYTEHNLPFFLVMDHLPKVIAKICPDSKIAQGLACARRKTTGIVRNVLGTESFKNLCDGLRRKCSLIVDESTDKSTKKHLCLVIRYFKNNILQDNFFGLIELSSADATTLYNWRENVYENFDELDEDDPWAYFKEWQAARGPRKSYAKYDPDTESNNSIPILKELETVNRADVILKTYYINLDDQEMPPSSEKLASSAVSTYFCL